MTQPRKPISQIVKELSEKQFDMSDANPLELSQELMTSYDDQLASQVLVGKERYPAQDFFVEVHVLRPRIFGGHVLQWVIMPRSTLPTPTFDTVVYRYYHETGNMKVLWVIPTLEMCIDIDVHQKSLDPSLNEIKEYVLAFKNGTLFPDTLAKYKETL